MAQFEKQLLLQQQLLQCQLKISNILESFTDAFFEVDRDWIVTYWNNQAEQILLMPRANVIGKNLWDVYADAIPLKFFSEYQRAVSQNISVRFEEFFSPRKLWVEVAAFPSGNGLSVYFKDITAVKHARGVLERERQKYINLFNLSPVPQWVYDLDTLMFLDVNQAAVSHYGYSHDEFLQMSIKDIRPTDDIVLLDEILRKNVASGIFNKSSVRHQKKNGDLISVLVEGNPVTFEDRKARLVMVIDRTAEILAGEALEASVKRYNIVSKATSDAIWDWNVTTGEMTWNQGLKGIFGHKRMSCTYQWWRDQVHPEDLSGIIEKYDSLTKSQKTRLKLEYRFRCADNSYRFVLDRAFIIFNAEGLPVRMIGSMQDITDRVNQVRAIENQNCRLREISWIQSHKVRSPLARILGLVSLMTSSKDDIDAVSELIPLLNRSAQELDQVVKEIMQKANDFD